MQRGRSWHAIKPPGTVALKLTGGAANALLNQRVALGWSVARDNCDYDATYRLARRRVAVVHPGTVTKLSCPARPGYLARARPARGHRWSVRDHRPGARGRAKRFRRPTVAPRQVPGR